MTAKSLVNPTSPYARECNPWAQEPQKVMSTIDDDQTHSLGLEWNSGSVDFAAPSRFTQYLYFLGYWGLNPVGLACALYQCGTPRSTPINSSGGFKVHTEFLGTNCCAGLCLLPCAVGKRVFPSCGSVLPGPCHGSPHRAKHSEKVVAHCVSFSILCVLTCIIIQHLVGPFLSGDKSSEA